MRHLEAPIFQMPAQEVLKHKGAKIADMSIAVNRRPTDIERYPRRIGWLKDALFAAHGVVKLQGHIPVLFNFDLFASRHSS